jgi:hypothetical protein
MEKRQACSIQVENIRFKPQQPIFTIRHHVSISHMIFVFCKTTPKLGIIRLPLISPHFPSPHISSGRQALSKGDSKIKQKQGSQFFITIRKEPSLAGLGDSLIACSSYRRQCLYGDATPRSIIDFAAESGIERGGTVS